MSVESNLDKVSRKTNKKKGNLHSSIQGSTKWKISDQTQNGQSRLQCRLGRDPDTSLHNALYLRAKKVTPGGEPGQRRTVARRDQQQLCTGTNRLSTVLTGVSVKSVKKQKRERALKTKKTSTRSGSRILAIKFPGTGLTKWELCDHRLNGHITFTSSLGAYDSRLVALLLRRLKMVLFRITRAIRLFPFLIKFITNKILNSLVIQLIGRLRMDILEFMSLESEISRETASISKDQTDLGETSWWNSLSPAPENGYANLLPQSKEQFMNPLHQSMIISKDD